MGVALPLNKFNVYVSLTIQAIMTKFAQEIKIKNQSMDPYKT